MGGGGGSDYEAAQKAQEAKKQAARDALNVYFGTAPTRPTAENFTIKQMRMVPSDSGEGNGYEVVDAVDQRGLNGAQSLFSSQTTEAAKNKAARDALYQKVRTDAYTAGKTGLDEDRTTAARSNKFELFAKGLNGGSEDIDQSALLDRTYQKGLLDLGAKADAAKADLAASDESTRLGLLQSIDAGMDQGSALSSALAQLKNNADSATAAAQGMDLGDLFDSAGLLYTKSRYAQGQQAAGSAYPWLFGGGSGGWGNKGSTGIVSSVGGRG